ncbi:glycosyl hydrolase [Streptomyces sp. NPDC007148]|uniref:glycosyl hydrolase n=1 Tax=Streptomyces sp. NPDC007148 TaxID=3364775 RepID=UPI0036C07AAE
MLASVLPSVSASAHTSAPADPQADAAAVQTLDWLAHLPGRAGNRVVSGAFGGHSGLTFSLTQTEALRNQTGQYPGLLACDYGVNAATIDHSCNATLKQWWADGGLVSVSAHVPNPVKPGWDGFWTRLETFDQLTDPSTATGAAWRATLDQIADGLEDLNAAGVPVLFRPLHEMNAQGSKTFWWSSQSRSAYKAVWRDMFQYLTENRGLHNLLWVYSPGCWSGDRAGYYPGDAYTDIVGLDCYIGNPAAAQGYAELTALDKPFAFSEIGPPIPSGSSVPATGSFDYAQWPEAIRAQFPATTYFLTWSSSFSPVNQLGGTS